MSNLIIFHISQTVSFTFPFTVFSFSYVFTFFFQTGLFHSQSTFHTSEKFYSFLSRQYEANRRKWKSWEIALMRLLQTLPFLRKRAFLPCFYNVRFKFPFMFGPHFCIMYCTFSHFWSGSSLVLVHFYLWFTFVQLVMFCSCSYLCLLCLGWGC